MLKRKVREHERVTRSYRLGLAHDVPARSRPPEVAREAFLQAAVVGPRLGAWKDRIARAELQRERSSLERADGVQAKALAPSELRHEAGERPSVEQRPSKERERPREIQCRYLRLPSSRHGTDEASELGVAHERPRVSFSLDGQRHRPEEQGLCQQQIGSQRELAGTEGLLQGSDEALSRKIGEQGIAELLRCHAQRGRHRGQHAVAATRGTGGLSEELGSRHPGGDRRAALDSSEPQEDMARQRSLPSRARAWQRLAQALDQFAHAATHEALALIDERAQPGQVVFQEEMGHDLVPADAKSEQ